MDLIWIQTCMLAAARHNARTPDALVPILWPGRLLGPGPQEAFFRERVPAHVPQPWTTTGPACRVCRSVSYTAYRPRYRPDWVLLLSACGAVYLRAGATLSIILDPED